MKKNSKRLLFTVLALVIVVGLLTAGSREERGGSDSPGIEKAELADGSVCLHARRGFISFSEV